MIFPSVKFQQAELQIDDIADHPNVADGRKLLVSLAKRAPCCRPRRKSEDVQKMTSGHWEAFLECRFLSGWLLVIARRLAALLVML